jgi:hypothetical protein
MALIHWKEARIWGVAWAGKNDSIKDGKHLADSYNIMPGVQHIEDDVWETMKALVPDVQDRLDSGQLIEVKDDTKGGKPNAEHGLPRTLAKFSAADAIELIGGVMDRDVLKAWHKTERRPAVKDAIKKQDKALEPEEDKKTEQ